MIGFTSFSELSGGYNSHVATTVAVTAHGKLFVRDGEEAACYQLTPDTNAAVRAE